MTAFEKEVWRETVGRLQPDWFPQETWVLLEQYCRHVSRAWDIAQELLRDGLTDRRRGELLRMEADQTRLIVQLATKMRIPQQSTRDKSARKPKGTEAKPPWEDEE